MQHNTVSNEIVLYMYIVEESFKRKHHCIRCIWLSRTVSAMFKFTRIAKSAAILTISAAVIINYQGQEFSLTARAGVIMDYQGRSYH